MGAQHDLGNGSLLVAIEGLDIYDYKPVGGASLFSATHLRQNGERVQSTHCRLPGRAVYRYELAEGTMTEYVTDADCFVREFDFSEPITMHIELKPLVRLTNGVYGVPKGAYFINDYPTAADAYFTVFGDNVQVAWPDVTVTGKGRLVIKLSETEEIDDKIGDPYSPICPGLPEDLRDADPEIRRAVEDFYFLVNSYRSDKGGFVSAVEWNMGYVRDLYGAARGMLAAGWYEFVQDILQFFYDGFVKCGFLATAYTLDGLYTPHRHECDRAENTGYIILLATEYLRQTGDRAFFDSIRPLLEWCLHAQSEVCHNGMLPFSGDETFVAGGMLPKVHLDDGSAEATMLFIESAARMASYLPNDPALVVAADAKKNFRANFVRNGRLIANNPARRKTVALPKEKHGCCMYCYHHRDLTPNEYGIYRCAECAAKPQADIRSDRVYDLPCVGMEPVFFASDLLTESEQKSLLEDVAVRMMAGKPSTEDSAKNTGYEYGLLLYGLTQVNSLYADAAAALALNARDEEGVWAEYYSDWKPTGMRWRIWETGVNICALLQYHRRKRV